MFKIKKWSSYQSYKDRNPPWVRLHKKTLDDYQFQKMTSESRALLPMLWLLAAEDEDPRSGLIRLGPEEIAYRLRRDPLVVKTALDEIVRAGFITRVDEEDADLFGMKSTSYETVTPELQNCHPEIRFRDQRSDSEIRDLDPVGPVDNGENGDKRGSSKNGSLIGIGSDQGKGSAGGYDVRDYLSEDELNEMCVHLNTTVHRSWDRKEVFKKFNYFVKNDPPKKPLPALKSWLDKNRAWLSRAP